MVELFIAVALASGAFGAWQLRLRRADLAERRRVEAEMQARTTELERRIAEQAAALAAADADLQVEIARYEQARVALERAHAEMLAASRRADAAEVAIGALQSVSTALNGLTVSWRLVSDSVRASRLASLTRLADLLEQHEHDLADYLTTDEKGRQIPAYLRKLTEHLAQEQRFLTRELESLRGHLEHIRQVVEMQQGIPHQPGTAIPPAGSGRTSS